MAPLLGQPPSLVTVADPLAQLTVVTEALALQVESVQMAMSAEAVTEPGHPKHEL